MPELVFGLVAYGLAVAVLFFVITRGMRRIFGPQRRLERYIATEVLQARLKRGEISQEEFDQATQILGDG